MKELNLSEEFIQQDIKKEPLSENDLTQLYKLSGSYEALTNKRAKMYSQQKLKDTDLQESDFKKLLLDHYTFLKRPVLINEDDIFIGNSKIIVASAKESLK